MSFCLSDIKRLFQFQTEKSVPAPDMNAKHVADFQKKMGSLILMEMTPRKESAAAQILTAIVEMNEYAQRHGFASSKRHEVFEGIPHICSLLTYSHCFANETARPILDAMFDAGWNPCHSTTIAQGGMPGFSSFRIVPLVTTIHPESRFNGGTETIKHILAKRFPEDSEKIRMNATDWYVKQLADHHYNHSI